MTVTRRSFVTSLITAFGAASTSDLTSRVQDLGRPILLTPRDVEQTIHVYEGGILTLGSMDDYDPSKRATWRQILEVEGVDVHDPIKLAKEMASRWLEPEELDQPLSDRCWPMAEACTWHPSARAERLLRQLKVGSSLRSKDGRFGRLDFHYADNHPGSSDIWVEAPNDLSVSLLQARLIELGKPIRVVMEVPTVVPIS